MVAEIPAAVKPAADNPEVVENVPADAAAANAEADQAEDSPAERPKKVGEAIGGMFGGGVDQDQKPMVSLVVYELDSSTSIGANGYKPVIVDNHNRCLAELRAIQTQHTVLVRTETFHGQVLNDYVSPAEAKDLTVLDYRTIFGTPLNFRVATAVQESEIRAEQVRRGGEECQRIIFFLSDGLDTPQQVEQLVPAEVTRQIVADSIAKGDLILLALGVKNGFADFEQTFQDLGIPKKWIMVCEGDPAKVADSMDGITRMVSHATTSAKGFHDTHVGGFTHDDPDS